MEIPRGGEGWFEKPIFSNENMTLTWNFRRGGGGRVQAKKLSVGGCGYFLEQHN